MSETTKLVGEWWRHRPGAGLLAPLASLAMTVILLLVGAAFEPGFLTAGHVLQLVGLAGFLGVVCIGQTIVIVTGGIDLSVAWVVTAAGVVFTGVTQGQAERLVEGLAAALAIGLAAGVANGVGVAALGISPIVMTLAMNNVMQGVALLYTHGTPTGGAPPLIAAIATGRAGPIPAIIIFWAGLAAITIVFLRLHRVGRYLYTVGENPLVGYLSGVRNDFVLIGAYAASGVAAASTGILFSGFSGASFLGMGDQFVLPSIAAVVLGGTSILGGRGGYAGTAIGAILLTILSTVLAVLNLSAGIREIASGAVIIVAMMLTQIPGSRR